MDLYFKLLFYIIMTPKACFCLLQLEIYSSSSFLTLLNNLLLGVFLEN